MTNRQPSPRPPRQTRQDAILTIVEALQAAGFEARGQTATQHVRIATVRSPVWGGIGGEGRTFGGRDRYVHPSGLRPTVGIRTVNFYRPGDEMMGLRGFATRDLPAILAFLANMDKSS